MGVGSKMMEHIQNYAWKFLVRTIRIDSARKAVNFFKRMGYSEIGDMFQCLCPGGGLFNNLQTLQKEPFEHMVESWD